MTPAELSRTVRRAVCRAVEEDALRVPVPERVRVERPRPGGRGDYASGVALKLAGPAGLPARAVAEIVRDRVVGDPAIAGVEITGPGFLNFTLAGEGRDLLVREVLARGSAYGYGNGLSGQHVVLGVPGPAAGAAGHDLRAAAWTHTVAGLLRTQGASVDVVPADDAHGSAPYETLRPVPALPGIEDELGPDAFRWALLATAGHDRPRTAGLLEQRETNELFRVRYAYARTRALARNAADLGFSAACEERNGHEERGSAPLTALADHPTALEAAARHRAPDRLARHLVVVADAVLAYQHTVLPLGDEKPSAGHRSRLAIAEAAGTVLAAGLSLLGISAPEYL